MPRAAYARPCSIEGCDKPITARGWCQMHYYRWKRQGDPLVVRHRHDGNRVDHSQTKTCRQCGQAFSPPPRCSHAQWDRREFCGRRCKNTHTAQQQRAGLKQQRGWATSWERHRRLQDQREIARQQRRARRIQRATHRPSPPRHFLGWYCKACGEPFVYFTKRAQSPYCAPCNEAHHRRPANRRAKQNGVAYEPIVPSRVFQRDSYRCQICKRKTRGTFPNPHSATVDHIIPLARGGPHVYSNVQCACFRCNSQKRDGSANDQLRLAIAA